MSIAAIEWRQYALTVVLIAAATLARGGQETAPQAQMPQREAPAQPRPVVLVGELTGSRVLEVGGGKRRLLRVQTGEGRNIVVDVGAVGTRAPRPQLAKGDRVVIIGTRARLKGQPLIRALGLAELHRVRSPTQIAPTGEMRPGDDETARDESPAGPDEPYAEGAAAPPADRATPQGRERPARRRPGIVIGELVGARTARADGVAAQRPQLLRLRVGANRYINLDVGTAVTLGEELDLERGDQVIALGAPRSPQDRRTWLATSVGRLYTIGRFRGLPPTRSAEGEEDAPARR